MRRVQWGPWGERWGLASIKSHSPLSTSGSKPLRVCPTFCLSCRPSAPSLGAPLFRGLSPSLPPAPWPVWSPPLLSRALLQAGSCPCKRSTAGRCRCVRRLEVKTEATRPGCGSDVSGLFPSSTPCTCASLLARPLRSAMGPRPDPDRLWGTDARVQLRDAPPARTCPQTSV